MVTYFLKNLAHNLLCNFGYLILAMFHFTFKVQTTIHFMFTGEHYSYIPHTPGNWFGINSLNFQPISNNVTVSFMISKQIEGDLQLQNAKIEELLEK